MIHPPKNFSGPDESYKLFKKKIRQKQILLKGREGKITPNLHYDSNICQAHYKKRKL
jgi:hypothetical protein